MLPQWRPGISAVKNKCKTMIPMDASSFKKLLKK
jgi:hypothetical protein